MAEEPPRSKGRLTQKRHASLNRVALKDSDQSRNRTTMSWISKPSPDGNCAAEHASDNVIAFPGRQSDGSPLDRLTARLVLAQHRAGTLSEGVLLALLVAVGLQP